MYIAPGQGLTTPGDKILMSTGTSCHFGHLLQVKKKNSLKSDFIHFFHAQLTLSCAYRVRSVNLLKLFMERLLSKMISNDQELIQSDPTSCPQNLKGNN